MPEIGQTVSHYRIVEKIGQGGMGEVYLADDTTLDRKVALKFLPEVFTNDPERMARFEREAKLLASLNHPNIAGIYGLEQAEGNRFLVLEYVEGETLQARLKKGALPLEDALELCHQIAEGLEAAHEKGVIHRDLKPANVMITAEEKVKILDFGLAKALADESQSVDPSDSPTITAAMTQPGVVLGTAAYMSPEQAKGKVVDKRADIWGFGCILYECLTGKKAFEGETVTETLASILKGELDLEKAPTKVWPLLSRCLEKNPKKRLRDIGDAMPLLEGFTETIIEKQHRPWLAWVLAAIAIMLVIAMAIPTFLYFHIKEPAEIMRFHVSVPPMPNEYNLAVSPDGRSIAFVASSSGSAATLFIRETGSVKPIQLDGTEGAQYPFWSPDSRSIAFFAEGRLKRVDVAGGQPQDICAAPNVFGGTWNNDEVIVFSQGMGVLRSVSAAGGKPNEISKLNESPKEVAHVHPYFLPDGQHFLYTTLCNLASKNGIYVGSLNSPEKTLILTVNSMAAYAEPGYLLFMRGRTLFVQPFDVKKLTLAGEAVGIADNLILDKRMMAGFSVSQNGVLIYRSAAIQAQSQFVWLDRSGKQLGTAGEPGNYHHQFELSPDGKQIAMRRYDPVTSNFDIWLMDWGRNFHTRFTNDPGIEEEPVWSPDGLQIAFASYRNGNADLFEKNADGIGEEIMRLDSPSNEWPEAWSHDGRYMAYTKQTGSEYNVYILPLFEEKPPFQIIQSSGTQDYPQISFDDKWLTYQSNESGTYEVYIISFPVAGQKRLVSNNGGMQPRWRQDGKELYYLAPDGNLMVVDINMKSKIYSGIPRVLFNTNLSVTKDTRYDVTSDGKRFLFLKPLTEGEPTPLTVILNWTKLLEK